MPRKSRSPLVETFEVGESRVNDLPANKERSSPSSIREALELAKSQRDLWSEDELMRQCSFVVISSATEMKTLINKWQCFFFHQEKLPNLDEVRDMLTSEIEVFLSLHSYAQEASQLGSYKVGGLKPIQLLFKGVKDWLDYLQSSWNTGSRPYSNPLRPKVEAYLIFCLSFSDQVYQILNPAVHNSKQPEPILLDLLLRLMELANAAYTFARSKNADLNTEVIRLSNSFEIVNPQDADKLIENFLRNINEASGPYYVPRVK
ncbi:hypothetical protein Lbir_2458 [Legionella birminghamensis]|uniref:Uncharacterized protein n=1 Tax=Legionella birminghamensis TaxID=28083 RepID=A0A378IA38_9GAMM|nr:hypothetical protein [Legionella birminghamensis]KTC68925.1 hypothetical protein Lbir_2458 [Legionella birminghamensis]STX31441.1 Uncharacterised protein [Legionella birminghamensis]